MGYTSEKGYGLLDSQLYMPEKWFSEEYADRRKKTLVPENLEFKTKNKIASDLLNKAILNGVKATWVGFDSAFGSDINFIKSIPEGMWYFGGIKSNEQVFVIKEDDRFLLEPKSEKEKLDVLLHTENRECKKVSDIVKSSSVEWQYVILGEGAKGPIISEMAFVRVYLSREKKPIEEEVWLVMRKHKGGKIRYAISNAPKDIQRIELIKASIMRWPIEQCFGDGKGNLGMDQYEHRSWPAWHRHMVFISLGLHLLLKLRLKSPSKKKLHF